MIRLRLDEILQEKNMSAYALHIKSGLHQSVISKIKRNLSKALQLDVLDKLCETLECSAGDLIVYENPNAIQDVNTQSVNTTRIVSDATQSVKPTTQSVNDTRNVWADVKAANKAARDKKPKDETLTDEDLARSKSSDNEFSFSVGKIVSGESFAGSPVGEYDLTTKDAGELLNLSPRTVRENAEKGLLHGKQGKQSHWFFRRSDIDNFIARRGKE